MMTRSREPLAAANPGVEPPAMRNAPRNHVVLGLGLLPMLWLTSQAPPAAAPKAPAAPPNPFLLSPEERARLEKGAAEDHADMMKQLGITRLRPGRSGFPKPGDPNAANYDPAQANPYPDWPEVLALKDGRKVTTTEMWWQKRRPEIVLDFEREVYGRVPSSVPKVAWTVAETVETRVGGRPSWRAAWSGTWTTPPIRRSRSISAWRSSCRSTPRDRSRC